MTGYQEQLADGLVMSSYDLNKNGCNRSLNIFKVSFLKQYDNLQDNAEIVSVFIRAGEMIANLKVLRFASFWTPQLLHEEAY